LPSLFFLFATACDITFDLNTAIHHSVASLSAHLLSVFPFCGSTNYVEHLELKQVGWAINTLDCLAPVFPGRVVGSGARPTPNPVWDSTNGPLPCSRAPGANHYNDLGPLSQDCIPRSFDLEDFSKTNDESDRRAQVDASNNAGSCSAWM